MNKLSFSDLSKLISSSNAQLFDRFVNIRLSKNERESSEDLIFNTPATGIKPDITVSGTYQAGQVVTGITVTVNNFCSNGSIDFNDFGYATVVAGYSKSGLCRSFKGQIINIYMAKPNPNGELVISLSNANIIELNEHKPYVLKFTADKVNLRTFVRICNTALGKNITLENIPSAWYTIQIEVNKATYTFDTAMEVIHWMNTKFIAMRSKDLKPIMALVRPEDGANAFVVAGLYSNGDTPVLKRLTNIGSAYMAGTEYGVITAPWAPEITPGEYIYVDSKYFKTRVNVAKFAANQKAHQSSVWNVTNIEFTFSTRTTNTMTMKLTNVDKELIQE